MNKILPILTLIGVMLASLASAQNATNTITPTFTSTTSSMTARIADAKLYMWNGYYGYQARNFLLDSKTRAIQTATESSALIDYIMASPAGENEAIPDELVGGVLKSAAQAKGRMLNDPVAFSAWVDGCKNNYSNWPSALPMLNGVKNSFILQSLARSTSFSQVITTCTPILSDNSGTGNVEYAVRLIAWANINSCAADALAWAKLTYMLSTYQKTQDGVLAVAAALRAADQNTIRANAFTAYQLAGTGTNLLSNVAVPTVTLTFPGTNPIMQQQYAAMNLSISGHPADAIKAAAALYAGAKNDNDLSGAVSLMAQCLRNADGNLVRANAYVAAQKAGTAYTISELQ